MTVRSMCYCVFIAVNQTILGKLPKLSGVASNIYSILFFFFFFFEWGRGCQRSCNTVSFKSLFVLLVSLK